MEVKAPAVNTSITERQVIPSSVSTKSKLGLSEDQSNPQYKSSVVPAHSNKDKDLNETLEKQVNAINDFMQFNFTSLKFNVHEESNRQFVQVVNSETKEIVREIPTEKFLDMMSKMMDYVGLIVDKKV